MADEAINPEVKKSLADLSGERVQQRSEQDFPRHFWSASKNGHYRFALSGVAIAAPISAAIGAAVCAVPVVGWAAAPVIIPAFIAAGSMMAVEGFGAAGAAAAARASGLAEKHARMLDAEAQGKPRLSALDDQLLNNGRGQYFETPTPHDEGKLFSWKSGLTGAGLGMASGAVIGLGMGGAVMHAGAGVAAATAHVPVMGAIAAAVAHVPLLGSAVGALAAGLTSLGLAAAAAPAVATLAVAGAITFGLFGLTFGVERKVLKSFFDHTDAAIQGKMQPARSPDLGRAQSLESDADLTQHRLRRQAEIERLERSYNDRISWGALSGRFRGFGGVVPGVAIGAAVGALALGGIALAASIPFAAAVTAHALILPLFAAAGGMLGMKVFSESGTEAGAEATARAIDNEFERNRSLRAQGITPPAPREAKDAWLNPKAGLIAGIAGAAAGVAIALAMAPALAAIIPVHLGTAALLGVSAIIGGGVGASYGLGPKTLKTMAKPFTALYDKVIFDHNGYAQDAPARAEQPQAQQAPALDRITAEDIAKINERSAAAGSKSFTQTITQQMQAQPANLTIGA
jgi:hypothetical protein